MAKNTLSFFSFFLVFAILLSSCQQDNNDPRLTLMRFSEALKKKDFKTARTMATAGSASTLSIIEKGLNTDSSNAIWLPVLTDDFEYKPATINGNEATVKMINKNNQEDFDIELVKQEEEWKVNFEISSLFRIMLHKLNKKGAAKARDLDETLNDLQQIDMNSVKNELDQSKHKLDSVKHEIRHHKK